MEEGRKLPGESKFQPFLDILPSNCRDFPMFFDNDEIAELDNCFWILNTIKVMKDSMKRCYDKLVNKIKGFDFNYKEF